MKKYVYAATLMLVWCLFLMPSVVKGQSCSHNLQGGDATLFMRANANCAFNNIAKPIIFIETFDFFNENSGTEIYNTINQNTFGLFSSLQSFGYDIIVVNFTDALDDIQDNAATVTELINYVNANKITDEKLVVIGHGLGGVVARYSLAKIESTNGDHDCRLYVSLDAPHRGFNIPIGIQEMIIANRNNPFMIASGSEFLKLIQLLDKPAINQLLIYNSDAMFNSGFTKLTSDKFGAFFDELHDLNNCNGYPTECRNIAISFGSWDSKQQIYDLDLNGDGAVNDPQIPGTIMFSACNCDQDGNCQGGFTQMLFVVSTGISHNYPGFDPATYPNSSNPCPTNNPPPLDCEFIYPSYNNAILCHMPPFFGSAPLLGMSGLFCVGFGGSSSLCAVCTGPFPTSLDVDPGSTFPYYKLAKDIINSIDGFDCGGITKAEAGGMIPTISALDFNADDPFYNILADGDALSKTPFDAIYAITGANLSHFGGASLSLLDISDDLLAELTNPDDICMDYKKIHDITVNINGNLTEENVNVMETENVIVKNGGKATLHAANSIELFPVFDSQNGSVSDISIVPGCEINQKPCNFTSSGFNSDNFAGVADYRRQMEEIIPYQTRQHEDKVIPNTKISVYPNPASGVLYLNFASRIQKGSCMYQILYSDGRLYQTGQAEFNQPQVIDVSKMPIGMYFIQTTIDGNIVMEKFVKI